MAYQAAEWSDLFVAVAGAGAALAGLVFVAVSINVERIVGFPGLPERALETVLLLLTVVLVSIVGLIPQTSLPLGAEILVLALVLAGVLVRLSAVRMEEGAEQPQWRSARLALRASGVLPFVVGGASLMVEAGGGLYWIVAGVVFAVIGGVSGGWVLLIEVLR